jgi:hypothetical protein
MCMHSFVCGYVCENMCVCVCMYIQHLRVLLFCRFVCGCVYVCMCVCMYVCTSIICAFYYFAGSYVGVYMCVCVYVYMYIQHLRVLLQRRRSNAQTVHKYI